ncbi:uncharacterized protein LOC143565080 [Bidens hawaiensis]|uniref:uncharacterized protein LOC143565080 n=1 Tax=Bidens hawaiensis TaxID=980011 RepID=UPI00404AD001
MPDILCRLFKMKLDSLMKDLKDKALFGKLQADDNDVEDVINKTTVGSSIFTGWLECNQKYDVARTLTYAEFPPKFVWKKDNALGSYVNKVRGSTCFENFRTVDSEVCATYRDACYKRGLLDDDNEYIEAIEEGSSTATGYYLRILFATILITYSLSRPEDVWEKSWQRTTKEPGAIEIFLVRNNSTLRCFPTMSFPYQDSISASTNQFMNEELAYDTDVMTGEFERLFLSLTDEQRDVTPRL